MGIYIHIPFCTKKCDYCHFYVIPDDESKKDRLLQALFKEWDTYTTLIQGNEVVSLYFGGGTPSLFGPDRIKKLIDVIKEKCSFSRSAEITLEANPENITFELMSAYANAGINRVSIGIQTLNADLLQLLGRMHLPQTATEAVLNTYKAGITNISVDLMYDLPNQKYSDWTHTLSEIVKLPITHLSLYNLTIEPHTSFYKRKKEIAPLIPDQELSLKMYQDAVLTLGHAGLKQYEISAFSTLNCEAIHNTGYWLGRPFIGLGPSAFSYFDGKRFKNISNFEKYCKFIDKQQSPIDFEEQLDPIASIRELFVVQLRLLAGVVLSEFEMRHGKLDLETEQTIKKLENCGWLIRNNGAICLTKEGTLFYDSVATDLI